MKTIIAPTDFSEASLNAVAYATDLAADINANLLLLHILELPVLSGLPISEFALEPINREQELNYLKEKMQQRTQNKIEVNALQTTGSLRYELKHACKLINPFAVVMSSHTPGAVLRILFGSTTLYSIHHLHYPVINVPKNAVYKSIKKIALATDLKNNVHIPADEIAKITSLFNASVYMVNVTNRTEPAAENNTEFLLLLNRLQHLNPQVFTINNDSIEAGIDLFARQNNIDLVVVVPHKQSIFHKSVSRQVVFQLPLPAMALMES